MSLPGPGPHGERPIAPAGLPLGIDEMLEARAYNFSVGVLLRGVEKNWERCHLTAIARSLDDCGASVAEAIDCRGEVAVQVKALDRLAGSGLDAIVSMPLPGAASAEAHRRATLSGKPLILSGEAPAGLMPGSDYAVFVSPDEFGLGIMAADLLSSQIPPGGQIGVLGAEVNRPALRQREDAFHRWMRARRPDIGMQAVRLPTPEAASQGAEALLEADPGLAGFFAVQDVMALAAMTPLARRGSQACMTTAGLGREAAALLAAGGPLRGIAADQPVRQGVAVARAAVLTLLRRPIPRWIVLPGLRATPDTLAEVFRQAWGEALLLAAVPARIT